MTQTCLVTGGAGFIGCAISKSLTQHFEHVVAVDNMHPQIHSNSERPPRLDPAVELVVADVTHESTWDDLLQRVRPDVIVHLAAETGTGQSLREASRHANVNVMGTARMMDALSRHGCMPTRVVLTSSRAVYGEGAWEDKNGDVTYPGQRGLTQLEAGTWDFPGLTCLPFEALRTQPNPTSIYGATKLTQELMLRAWAQSFNVEVGLLRLQNVYGPGQSLNNPYTGIVSLFARLAKSGQTIPLYEDGEIVRDFVFIDDVADAIVRMATLPIPSDQPYDVGSGEATTIRELANTIAGIYGAPTPIVNGAFRNGDVRAASCDISRTSAELGWTPRWSVTRGVKELCAWIDGQENAGPPHAD